MNWKEKFKSPRSTSTIISQKMLKAHYVALEQPQREMVDEFMALTGSGLRDALASLTLRAYNKEFALEYFERSKLLDYMSDKERYPKWQAFIDSKTDKVEE